MSTEGAGCQGKEKGGEQWYAKKSKKKKRVEECIIIN